MGRRGYASEGVTVRVSAMPPALAIFSAAVVLNLCACTVSALSRSRPAEDLDGHRLGDQAALGAGRRP